MNLQLSLTRKWFEMTESGEKTEDYRSITPYWAIRLIGSWLWVGKQQGLFPKLENSFMSDHIINGFKTINTSIMTLGYPKRTDTSRIIKFECKGIEIGYGKPEWGAKPGRVYFIIKHGKRLDQ